MWAAREGHVDAVRVLVELGANIEAADKVRDGCRLLCRRLWQAGLTRLCAEWLDAAHVGSS